MDPQVEQLCTLAWNGDVEKAKPLLEEMSSEKVNIPNSRGKWFLEISHLSAHPAGQSALYCAARNGKDEIIELLSSKKGLNVNIQVASHGGTPLHGRQ